MRRVLFLLLVNVCAVAMICAQQPFEGTIVYKLINSYSQEVVNVTPYYYSGSDTVVAYIKGNELHLHFKQSGIHRIYTEGKICNYSENTKEGYAMPERPTSKISDLRDDIETNEKRELLGKTCRVKKSIILLNNSTIEIDSWVTENTYHLSDKTINLLNTNIAGIAMGETVWMKLTRRDYVNGNVDLLTQYAKSVSNAEQRQLLWGSVDEKTSEISSSQIFEVLSIQQQPISADMMRPASDIIIEDVSLQQVSSIPAMDVEMLKAAFMANPQIRKKVEKGKMNLDDLVREAIERQQAVQQQIYSNPEALIAQAEAVDKAQAESMRKSIEDYQACGGNEKMVAYGAAFIAHEKQLLLKNKEWLKEHGRIGQEAVKPVAYDLDEEWDF